VKPTQRNTHLTTSMALPSYLLNCTPILPPQLHTHLPTPTDTHRTSPTDTYLTSPTAHSSSGHPWELFYFGGKSFPAGFVSVCNFQYLQWGAYILLGCLGRLLVPNKGCERWAVLWVLYNRGGCLHSLSSWGLN
jgi:hypothetical protein